MRASALIALLTLGALCASDFAPAFAAPRGRRMRTTRRRIHPNATLQALKRAVTRRDSAGEWAVLSPDFKRRLNQRVGRTVDLADYTHVRNMQRRNPQVRQAEGALRQAKITRVRWGSPRRGYAKVTIWFQGPLVFGKQETVSMVLLTRWEVWVEGEPQPFWGFENDPGMGMQQLPDGRVHLWSRDQAGQVTWQQVVPKEKVRSVNRKTTWYFDHLGALENYFG